ncbi:MAG: alpha/beta fold hydrolase [Dehalococcoidia bacterium]|nr:alpha/beta fold hydrolase [Dehalococcoidia bacterium]MDP7241005.1 alpha/beta fold hydrolase [Dehalococcoidia bacterium]
MPLLVRKYRVASLDLRGFRRYSKPPRGYRLSAADNARDLNRFMNTLGLEKASVVEAKLGGMITLQFAHDYPERCGSLTVVGCRSSCVEAGRVRRTGPE